MLHYKIFIGNSNNVPAIDSNSIHFIFTSPPYGLSKTVGHSPQPIIYDQSNIDNIGNYSGDEYLEMMKPVYKENYRILKQGRKMIVNIVDVVMSSPIDNKFTTFRTGEKTVKICEDIGFAYEDVVIWDKIESTAVRILGSWPYPGSVILAHRWEYCFIFRKPGDIDWSHLTEREKEAGKMSNDYIGKHFDNIWRYRAETRKHYHPAPFPIELPREAIRLYTYPNEIVYDCFGGTGTTLQAAKELQRSGYITEIGFQAKDEKPWLDHVKEETNWGSGDLASSEVIYTIAKTDGTELEKIEVKGLGDDKLLEESSHSKGSNLFEFGLEIPEEEKAELPKGEGEWKNPETNWVKQKKLL